MAHPDDIQREMGFPDGTVFRKLQVSIPAQCVAVTASVASDPSHTERLFVRAFSTAKYREVAWPSGCNSFDIPVLSHVAPELFVMGMLWRDISTADSRRPGKTVRGANHVGLYRVRLPDGQAELMCPAGSPTSRDVGPNAEWFLSELLTVTLDGMRLIVTRSTGQDQSGTTNWSYSVGEFDPQTGRFLELMPLATVFV